MSPEFLGNYITGRRQFGKVKVDRWLSLVFYLEKNVYIMIICFTVNKETNYTKCYNYTHIYTIEPCPSPRDKSLKYQILI
jgi:hypothetical protein